MHVFALTISFVFILGSFSQYYSGVNGALIASYRYRPKRCAFFFCFAAIVLIFVAGLREHVGSDYGAYYYNYSKYANDLVRSIKELDEPGIRFIYWVTVHIWDDGAACIFTVAAVTLGLELRAIYHNSDQLLFSLLLFVLIVWTDCFNGVRQALAASVLCCGFRFLKEKKFFPYLIIVLLASLCHKTAIVMIAVYPVCHMKINFRNLFLMIVCGVILLFSMDKLFQLAGWVLDGSTDTSNLYANPYWMHHINRLRVVAACAPPVFFLLFYWKKERTQEEEFLLNLLLIHAVFTLLTMNSACLNRITSYSIFYLTISIPLLLKRFSSSNRKISSFCIVCLYSIFEYVEFKGTTWNWIWNR